MAFYKNRNCSKISGVDPNKFADFEIFLATDLIRSPIQSYTLNLNNKDKHLRAIEVSFTKLQVICEEYYAIEKNEKKIIAELKFLLPILVFHWEKMVIQQAKWNQYIANKAKFIEERIIEIDKKIKKLDEAKDKAINDGRYLDNPNPSYDCAKARFKLNERRLQFTYLQRNISPAAHKDKADSSVNHQPQLQEQMKPQTHTSSNNSVLTVSLEEDSFKSQEAANPPPPDETPVLHSSASNLGHKSQADDHAKSRQEGSAVDSDNTLTHRGATNEKQSAEVSASSPSLQNIFMMSQKS